MFFVGPCVVLRLSGFGSRLAGPLCDFVRWCLLFVEGLLVVVLAAVGGLPRPGCLWRLFVVA